MRILVVEDSKDLNRLIVKALTKAGYSVDGCFDGQEALDYLAGAEYDGMVLDVMMPRMDGRQLLAKLRAEGSSLPVLLLTARDAVEDRVAGLDAGADDYLVKPFAFEELLARIRAMTRKHAGSRTGLLRVGDLTLDTRSRTAERAGRPIPLLPKEYSILEHMMRHPGAVLSREQLEDRIWNYEKAGSSNNIDGYMSRLRKKIDPEGDEATRMLHTLRGAGWVLRPAKNHAEGSAP